MNRKLIYVFSLIGFFLMWSVFGFAAAAPRSEPVLKATAVPENNNLVAPETTANSAIPVTGDTQPVAGILFTYGLFGLGALILILALLTSADKLTSPALRRKDPPDES